MTVQPTMPGQTLKGLQIRARPRTGDTERIIGEFISWPEDKTQTLDCLGGIGVCDLYVEKKS